MRTYDEAFNAARDEPAFSNNDMWEWWAERWCYRCANDSEDLVSQGKGCPLILVAMMGKTPAEFLTDTEEDAVFGNYRCIEFRNRDDPGDYEPKPIPDPPGQILLLPREPFEGVRMPAMAPEREAVTA